MTFDGTDMSTPVTRGELREDLAQLENRFDQKLEKLENRFDQKLEKLENRFDQKLEKLEQRVWTGLEAWGNVLLARIDASEQRLLTELARHTKAAHESMATQISIIDEKYADLPGRVSRLEAKVFTG